MRNQLSLSQVSIIIPYYKSKETINRLVENLTKSGIEQSQILIVDDASKDHAIENLKSVYPKITIIKNKKNQGAAYSRNIGIINSKNKYIILIDSDIIFDGNQLKKIINNISSYDIVFPKIIYSDGTLMNPYDSYGKKYCMCSAIFSIKRKSLEKLDELFDSNYFIYGEDSDFFLRCKASNFKFKYLPDCVFTHKIKSEFSERTYYLRTRNVIYFSLKLRGIISYKESFLKYAILFTLYNFLTAVLNRDIQLRPLKIKKIKYSNNLFPRIRLLYLFFSSILWNIKMLSVITEKRKHLKNYYQLNQRVYK